MNRVLLLLAMIVIAAAGLTAQQSDFELQQSFQQRAAAIRQKIDSAQTTSQLDALKGQIDALAIDFQGHKDFLDKALYPDSFEGRINALKRLHEIAYSRISTIQTQTTRITELESTLTVVTVRLDTMTAERERLFSDLQGANKNLANLRETVKRLTANLQANDRLVFSLVDSIFLPYDRNMRQASDIEKENIAGKLQQANVLGRVYTVASDNVKFLQSTQLQPKDYSALIEQYQQFRSRWVGLSDKMKDVVAAAQRRGQAAGGQQRTTEKAEDQAVVATAAERGPQVDSVMSTWHAALMQGFWSSIEKEFTSKGVNVNHFTDGPTFASAVRALVGTYKDSGADPEPFVQQVWKDRIDKEWRDALTKDAVLGRAEYASLDRSVSELGQKQVDLKLILYIVGIILIALAAWWLLSRKPKQPREVPPSEQ